MKRPGDPKSGDVIRVEIRDESIVCGHFLKAWKLNGPLVEFYECPLSWVVNHGFSDCKKLFGPIIVLLKQPVREGKWEIIGSIPVEVFNLPKFLMMGRGYEPIWWVCEGSREEPLGVVVPDEYKSLERYYVYTYEQVEQRLLDGTTPYSLEGFKKAYGIEP